MKQKNLGRMLRDELISLGVTDAELTEEGLVYASIPSTMPDGTGLSIGFVAHGYFSGCRRHRCKPWVLKVSRWGCDVK